MKTLIKLSALLFGGATGTFIRYKIFDLFSFSSFYPIYYQLPTATFFINLCGSFSIGILYALMQQGYLSLNAQLLLITGFLGAFTTFSTFALDCFKLLQDGKFAFACLYLLASNIFTIISVFLGYSLTKYFLFAIKKYFS